MLCTKVLMFLFMQNLNCFRPLARWIGSYIKLLFSCICSPQFPSPREVDRFLYIAKNVLKDSYTGFRPLARWIGSYKYEPCHVFLT